MRAGYGHFSFHLCNRERGELTWQRKSNGFRRVLLLLDRGSIVGAQMLEDFLHHCLGRTGAGGDRHALFKPEPGRVQVGHAIDEVDGYRLLAGQFREALAVGTISAGNNQD